jgi:hypothetical protein
MEHGEKKFYDFYLLKVDEFKLSALRSGHLNDGKNAID